MRTTDMIRNFILTVFALLLFSAVAGAQTTEFTYQGKLQDSSAPANGSFDFEFLLFDSLAGPTQIGSTLTRSGVMVTNGVFAVKLDFGSNFPGAARFLNIHVRQTGGGSFTPLTPRQSLSSVPYAVKSLNTDNATNATSATTATNATQLGGQPAAFYQDAANLTTGTLADARLSANVATLAGTQTFTGAKTFSAPSVFNGTVGIGTASPARALSVVGGLVVDQGNQNASDVNTVGINFGTGPGSGIASNRSGAGVNLNGLNFYAGDNSFPRMVLTTSGELGLGTSTPGAMLHVNGTVFASDNITTGAYFGSGAALTALNASNISSGTLPNGRLAGSYTGALTLSNASNAFTGTFNGSGAGFTGSGAGLTALNASNLSTGTVADARLSSNVGFLSGFQNFSGVKWFNADTTFNAPVTTNAGTITAGTALFLSNVGIGTFGPGAPLDVQVAAGQSLQFRQDGGLVPGIKVNTTGGLAGIMRLRNAIEIWPSDDATRPGKLDVRNTAGNSTISLDGQTGSITAANFPRAKVVQTYRDVRNINAGVAIPSEQSPNIDSITVNIPSSGVLMLRGTIQLFTSSIAADPEQNAFFKLSDNTAGPVTLCETNLGKDITLGILSSYDTLVVEWTVDVNAGTRTYGTSLYNQSAGGVRYFTTSLQAIFMPGGL